ncbi:MAG: sulfate adenylyltransferase [Rhodospirillaceae bacterium]|nr:sulfate adenylyltransferase [Rhodospirillaceae bacterium]
MANLVPPHGGGELKALLLPEADRASAAQRAETLKKVPMTSREASDVLMFAMGAYTPLDGFMNEDDWRGTCGEMKLANGIFWPIPVTLSADQVLAESIEDGEEVALVEEESGDVMALMTVTQKYTIDRSFECENVFATTDEDHPGVAKVMQQRDINLAGPISVFNEGEFPTLYKDLYLRPSESRALFEELGWSKVTAFQTRNPMHRSHEHLVKIAIEVTDGVFIHQVLGKLKEGDIPADTRTKAIAAMIDNYFVDGTAVQAGYPIEMRYAGPREALFHALIRQNFGCAYLVVGRDHAGVGDYYGPFDAQHVFDTLWDGALETQPLKIDITFYCKKCYGMATGKTCPHGPEDRINISGTMQREMLTKGEDIPTEFSRPEVVKILQDYYASLK